MKELDTGALTLGFPLTLVPMNDTRRHWFFAECPLNQLYLPCVAANVPALVGMPSRPASNANLVKRLLEKIELFLRQPAYLFDIFKKAAS